MKDGEGVSGGEMGLASRVNIELVVPWFSKWGPGTAVPAAPGSLSEMPALGPHLDLLHQKLRGGTSSLGSNKPSRGFWYILRA